MKNKGYITTLIIFFAILMSNLIISAKAQPYYDAYFTSIMVTNRKDTIELINGGTAKVYDGQKTWENLTFYNEACGIFGANLYTKIYANDTLLGTSSERYVWKGTYSNDDWYSTLYGPVFWQYKVELWWDSAGTHYLEDRNYFNIKVVKLFVTDWSPSTLSVERGKTTASTLSPSFKNGGNDYMYGASISVIDSDGLTISPDTQNLQDIASGGTKSTSFSVTAPSTATLGTHTVKFKINYNDFRDVSHSETKTAPIDVTKLSTSIALTLQESTLKRGASTTITAKLTDGNNVALANKEISFSIGTTSIGTANTDSSGNAVKTYTADIDAGTYAIKAFYAGSTDYGSSSATSNLLVNPLDTTLTINAPSVKVGATATITTTLKDENGNPISDANIDFYLFENNAWSKISTATTNAVGSASITRTFNTAGDYQIKTAYAGSTNYKKIDATATLIISQFATTLTIDVPSATQGKEVTLKATLKDEGGSPLRNIDVDFYVYEANAWKKIGSTKTDSNGVASLKYTPSSTGTFQVKAMFSGTTNYAQSNSPSANLNVAMDYTPLYYIGGGIIALTVLGIVGYVVFRRRKKATLQSQK
jgi:5-hydroxyisourate hydrolase-like protein (transthyretin family)